MRLGLRALRGSGRSAGWADESATGWANFWSNPGAAAAQALDGLLRGGEVFRGRPGGRVRAGMMLADPSLLERRSLREHAKRGRLEIERLGDPGSQAIESERSA